MTRMKVGPQFATLSTIGRERDTDAATHEDRTTGQHYWTEEEYYPIMPLCEKKKKSMTDITKQREHNHMACTTKSVCRNRETTL